MVSSCAGSTAPRSRRTPALWFARTQHDVVETVAALVAHLRGALEVGGLALRAFHVLERVRLPAADPRAGTITVPFEFRVTVLAGRAIGVSYHGPYEVLEAHQRDALDDALRARASTFNAIDALVPRLLAAGFPANFVADVVFDADGSPLVLELNPLYAAGYNVPAAHAWVVASLAHALVVDAGGESATEATIARHAEALLGASIDGCPAFRRS